MSEEQRKPSTRLTIRLPVDLNEILFETAEKLGTDATRLVGLIVREQLARYVRRADLAARGLENAKALAGVRSDQLAIVQGAADAAYDLMVSRGRVEPTLQIRPAASTLLAITLQRALQTQPFRPVAVTEAVRQVLDDWLTESLRQQDTEDVVSVHERQRFAHLVQRLALKIWIAGRKGKETRLKLHSEFVIDKDLTLRVANADRPRKPRDTK